MLSPEKSFLLVPAAPSKKNGIFSLTWYGDKVCMSASKGSMAAVQRSASDQQSDSRRLAVMRKQAAELADFRGEHLQFFFVSRLAQKLARAVFFSVTSSFDFTLSYLNNARE